MSTPLILQPWHCRGLRLQNRVVVPPMCTGLAEPATGLVNDEHLTHYGTICKGGYGLIIVEATAVEYRGHISILDLGIFTEAQVEGHRRLNEFIHRNSSSKTCLQLAHAGRKGLTDSIFGDNGKPPRFLGPKDKFGVESVAPSGIPHDSREICLHELTEGEIEALIQAFRVAALNAIKAGYDCLELHAAHGYLLHQFLSPVSNHRKDKYGGSIDNRSRLVLEIVEQMRKVMPEDMPLFVRISAVDWVDEGWTIEDSIYLSKKFKEAGVDVVDTSSGGVSHKQDVLAGWTYQTELAKQIRREAGTKTMAVGRITTLDKAIEVMNDGCCDLVAIGRSVLKEPYWLRNEARRLGLDGVPPLAPMLHSKLADLSQSAHRVSSAVN